MGDMGEADGEFLRGDAEEDGGVRLDAPARASTFFTTSLTGRGWSFRLYYSRVE
jgi:hypothetical protein